MTRLEYCLELVGDIRDCALRAKDLGFGGTYSQLCRSADGLEAASRESAKYESLPPVLASNQEARAKADEHFKNARKILKGIIK